MVSFQLGSELPFHAQGKKSVEAYSENHGFIFQLELSDDHILYRAAIESGG